MSEPIELLEAHELWGEWWLPSSPEARYGGMLAYSSSGGVTLKLAGGFESGQWKELRPGAHAYTGGIADHPVVHGHAGGKQVTLLGVKPTRSVGGIEPYEQTLIATDALIGLHLESGEETAFIGVECVIENLALWLRESCLLERRGRPGDDLISGIELHRRPAQEAREGSAVFTIWHQWKLRGINTGRDGYRTDATDRPAVTVGFGTGSTITDVKATVHALQDMMTFIAREPSAVLSIRAMLPPEPERFMEGHPERDLPRRVGIMTTQRGSESLMLRRERAPHLLITAEDLAFAQLVPRWFAIREKHRAAFNLLLSLRFGGHAYVESRLLASVGAAESLCRGLNPPRPFSRAAHKGLQKAAASAVEREHHDWVMERLATNEAPLRERLEFLVERLPERIGDLVVHDRAQWARLAVDARNRLTHVGRAPNHSLESLLAIIEVNIAVVTLNILNDLGVPSSALHAIATDLTRLGDAGRRAREQFGAAAVVSDP